MNSEDLPMNTSAHQGLQPGDAAQAAFKDSNRVNVNSVTTDASRSCDMLAGVRRVRVRVVSENRLLHEGLLRMPGKHFQHSQSADRRAGRTHCDVRWRRRGAGISAVRARWNSWLSPAGGFR
jgi:hypothetical protein